MASKLLPLILLGGGAYLVTQAANTAGAIKRLTVRTGRIKKVTFKGLSLDAAIELIIQNPGSVDIPFEYYTGTISHGGTKISDFTFNGQGKNIILKGRSDTPVLFNATINSLGFIAKFVQILKDIQAGKPVDTKIAINSSLYAAGFDIPVNFVHDLKPGAVSGLGKIHFPLFRKRKKSAFILPLFRNRRHKATATIAPVLINPETPIVNLPTPAAPVQVDNSYQGWAGNEVHGIGRLKKTKIGKPSARLEFDSNDEMANHFGCKDRPKIFFSKN